MKRYLLFAGYWEDGGMWPGGWRDFVKSFDSRSDATEYARYGYDWAHVVDTETWLVVADGRGGHGDPDWEYSDAPNA